MAVAAGSMGSKKGNVQISNTTTVIDANGSVKRVSIEDYTSVGVKDNDIFKLPSKDWIALAFLVLVATIVRLFKIGQPTSVVFDEVHFGGFARKYIKGQYFMDVHPPLAKLLITLAGWFAGFDGEFDFKTIGKDYLEPGVPYVAMRMLPALLGIATIPTMFLTLKASGCRTSTAALGAALVTFENGLVTQSRLILLDSPLLIFTALTALAFTCFTNVHEQGPSKAFTLRWWGWLFASGLFLGATASVKWVGLFTIAWIGSLTLVQLWVLLGDSKNVTPRLLAKHFLARVFCLIFVPVLFYMAMFGIHFLCLVNPGEGDGFMSSEFQATLNTKGLADVVADVAYGSRVSLKHHNTQGGYLHSHGHMYPGGSKQQQITLYPHKDDNNVWLLENATQPLDINGEAINGTKAWDTISPPSLVQDGALIRLYHAITDRRLHSHDVRPPVTEADWQNEVSAYGYAGFDGDANDVFRVEIVKSMSEKGAAQTRLRTIQTKFRLVHVMTGCVLFSHKVKLPTWGFEQQEVTCARGGTLPNSVWYLESNLHPVFTPDMEKVNYRVPTFLEKFWELQTVMWKTNAGLTDSHAWDSRPPSWPVLLRGINFWGKDNRQIYLMGNPVIWYSSTLAILVYFLVKGIFILRWQRGYKDYDQVTVRRFDYEIGSSVLGWAFHYLPFFLMSRQLFLHHYFPALYFAIWTLCQIYDHVTTRADGFVFSSIKSRPVIGQSGIVVFLAASIAAFTWFSPIAYGGPWTKDLCRKSQLLSTWDFDCNLFHDDLLTYMSSSSVSGDVVQTPASAEVVGDQAADVKASEAVTPSMPSPDANAPLYRRQDGGPGGIPEDVKEKESPIAPPHPDADPATPLASADIGSEPNSAAPVADDKSKEQSAEASARQAQPGEDPNEATNVVL